MLWLGLGTKTLGFGQRFPTKTTAEDSILSPHTGLENAPRSSGSTFMNAETDLNVFSALQKC